MPRSVDYNQVIARKRVLFGWEFNIHEFFEIDNEQYSDTFNCIKPFRLIFKASQDINGNKYLGIFLKCDNNCKRNEWVVRASYTLSILNNRSSINNVVFNVNHVFNNNRLEYGKF